MDNSLSWLRSLRTFQTESMVLTVSTAMPKLATKLRGWSMRVVIYVCMDWFDDTGRRSSERPILLNRRIEWRKGERKIFQQHYDGLLLAVCHFENLASTKNSNAYMDGRKEREFTRHGWYGVVHLSIMMISQANGMEWNGGKKSMDGSMVFIHSSFVLRLPICLSIWRL